MFEYKNYPKVPKNIVDEIVEEANKQSLTGFSDKVNSAVKEAYGNIVDTNLDGVATMTMFTNDKLTDWVKNNVTDKFNAVHVQCFSNGTYFFPHVDLLRTRALNYILKTADAKTVFYKSKNNIEVKPNTVISYQDIEVVNTRTFEPYEWHELKVDNIHSVENINGTRIAITVSFL